MAKFRFLIIALLINLFISDLYKGIKSKCTKNLEKENIDGTLACLRETEDIFVPYYAIKNYTESIKNEDCDKAKEIFNKYKSDKKFLYCHHKWNVELIE